MASWRTTLKSSIFAKTRLSSNTLLNPFGIFKSSLKGVLVVAVNHENDGIRVFEIRGPMRSQALLDGHLRHPFFFGLST